MSKKAYIIINVVMFFLKGAILLSLVLLVLPLWEINIPVWGLVLIVIAFLAYEVVTFRLGKKSLERRPFIRPEDIIGRCGKAATAFAPDGYVRVDGELWRAFSDDAGINEGDEIIVIEIDRLTLRVAPSNKK